MELGQTKVPQLDFSFGIIEDVVRLEVSMNDALRVYVSQPR